MNKTEVHLLWLSDQWRKTTKWVVKHFYYEKNK